MNLWQLTIRQMRQRLLSTLLTCLSILLGMTLATSVLILGGGREVFAQTDYGLSCWWGQGVAAATGDEHDLSSGRVAGNIPYRLYEDLGTGGSCRTMGKPNPFRGMAAWRCRMRWGQLQGAADCGDGAGVIWGG